MWQLATGKEPACSKVSWQGTGMLVAHFQTSQSAPVSSQQAPVPSSKVLPLHPTSTTSCTLAAANHAMMSQHTLASALAQSAANLYALLNDRQHTLHNLQATCVLVVDLAQACNLPLAHEQGTMRAYPGLERTAMLFAQAAWAARHKLEQASHLYPLTFLRIALSCCSSLQTL